MSKTKIETIAAELSKRRTPCLVSFLHPFRIVNAPDSNAWDVSIEQVNSASWDYVALHKVVGGIDVGLETPYHLVVCRDGGLALPPIRELTEETKAVEFFNQCLASFLLGGIYCEAIALDGLDFGSILDWKFIRANGQASAMPNRFHKHVRMQAASSLEAIELQEPRILKFTDLAEASKVGRETLERIPEVSGEFLLRGATGYARRDWGIALANFWIVIEQMTSHLWETCVVSQAKDDPSIDGRIDSLKDNRTWTAGVRHEVLFQKGLISKSAFADLNRARKARNKLSHAGQIPDEASSKSALKALRQLLVAIVPDIEIPFLTLDLDSYGLSDPFCPKDSGPINPKYWMEIKKLPGETELEKMEAEVLSITRKRSINKTPAPTELRRKVKVEKKKRAPFSKKQFEK